MREKILCEDTFSKTHPAERSDTNKLKPTDSNKTID